MLCCLYVMHISTRVLRQSNIIVIMENAPGNASSELLKYCEWFLISFYRFKCNIIGLDVCHGLYSCYNHIACRPSSIAITRECSWSNQSQKLFVFFFFFCCCIQNIYTIHINVYLLQVQNAL